MRRVSGRTALLAAVMRQSLVVGLIHRAGRRLACPLSEMREEPVAVGETEVAALRIPMRGEGF
jgi:hypothetical protein